MGLFDDFMKIIDNKDGDPLSKLADGLEKTLVNGLDRAEEGLKKLESLAGDADERAQAALKKVDAVSEKAGVAIDKISDKLGSPSND